MRENFFISYFGNDILFILPEIYFLNIILLLLGLGVIFDKYIITLGQKLIVIILKFGIINLCLVLFLYLNQLDIKGYIFNYKCLKDELAYLFIFIILIGSIIVLLLKIHYLNLDRLFNFEYIILNLLSILGILFLVISNDFLILYLSIELQSLCFYIMVGFKQNSDISTEAGLKYFIYGAFASGILLLGISLIYGFVGLINFTDLLFFYFESQNLILDKGILFGFLCIFSGLFFKVGAAPFHGWLPDIYQGASLMVTAFFAVVPKVGIFNVLLKIYYEILDPIIINWYYLFLWSAFLSIIIGIFGSLVQKSIKRLMGYSAISHIGFILLGFITLNKEGVFSILLYIIIYMLIIINFFSIFMSLRLETNNSFILSINKLFNLYQANKMLAICLGIVLFSIIGIPPLLGFYSKLYIFIGLLKQKLFGIAIISILLSAIAVVYYLKIVRIIFLGEGYYLNFLKPISIGTANIISLSLLMGIFYGYYSLLIIYILKNVVINFYI